MAEPGYHLEILGEIAPSDDETETEETVRRISDSLSVWGGAKNLVDEAESRLRAGEIYDDDLASADLLAI